MLSQNQALAPFLVHLYLSQPPQPAATEQATATLLAAQQLDAQPGMGAVAACPTILKLLPINSKVAIAKHTFAPIFENKFFSKAPASKAHERPCWF
jgi:hypothetical protein